MTTLTWATTGTLSGLQNNQQGNAIAAALATLSQGGSAPTAASTGLSSAAGLVWHDTANNLIKVRDQADTTWIPIGSIDETNKAFIPYYRNAALPGYLHGGLWGCTLSNDVTLPNTKIDIASGFWVDDTAAFAVTPGALSIDFTINGAGGLDTGALAASTWCHCFEIAKADGTVAGFASTSLTPVLPTGYSYKRRLGSVLTDGSAHIIPFIQKGDNFWWSNGPLANIATGTLSVASRTLVTVSTPLGISVTGVFALELVGVSSNSRALLTDPDGADAAVNNSSFSMTAPVGSAEIGGGQVLCQTNTSSQIGTRGDTAVSYNLSTVGFIDPRGRLN